MKQIKIPFSLSEYQKGGYILKSGENDARILCTDLNNSYGSIVVAVKEYDKETVQIFHSDGIYCKSYKDSSMDLFLVKYEFEDGDIIYSDYEHIAVFKKYSEDKTVAHTYIFLPYLRPFDVNIKYFKLASKKEKSLFLAKLAFNSKKWNDKTKQIEDMKQEFEDGDIVTNEKDIAIYKEKDKCYCGITEHDCLVIDSFFYYKVIERLATEEERQKLFNALKKEGKQWNAEKKQIEDMKKEYEFHTKDWCLMRCEMAEQWTLCQFSHIYNKQWVVAVGGNVFSQCIPYNEETKYLLGTADDCPDKYKTW